MHIDINDKTTLREIQHVFSEFYPFLKIEFYSRPHKKYEATDEIYRQDPESTIGEVQKTHVSGVLEILPTYKIAALERELQQRFGLSAQIFRKEKNTWEQTTGMDDLTLKAVNEMGRNSSDEFIVEDYDEGFEDDEEGPDILY